MKIKFNSDDNLPLNKVLNLHSLTIFFRSAFPEDGKNYPRIFLDECLYKLQMLEYDRIVISEKNDISKANAPNSFIFVITGIFEIAVLSMNHIFPMVVMISFKSYEF